jgi:hypothetical protein
MAERIRIQLHEATDVQRMIREYAELRLDRGAIVDIIDEHSSHGHVSAELCADEIIECFPQLDEANLAHVEDLVNRIGEVYETALARRGRGRVVAAESEERK